ncbi:MAG: OmpA family protein [Thiovulaceae bacterium]|nr:OmpA family protein [Sulfurimonadaceae bacterium]
MKKNVILSSVAVAVLLFSGCSTNKPTVDQTAKTITTPSLESSSVNTETTAPVTSNNATDNVAANGASMADIEKSMTSVYFDFDKFNIREDMKANVSTDSSIAKAAASAYGVKLEGNCDEWGSDEYNFALGLKRAQAVKTELVNEGVDAKRISMVSLGKSTPVCTEKTKECWAKNRRVDFKLLP